MLLKIQDTWINPNHVARVYLYTPNKLRIQFAGGGTEDIDVPHEPMKNLAETGKEFLDEIAMMIAVMIVNNQTESPASLPEAIAKARGNPEPPTSRVAFAATCKDGRHIVHPECTACECGYLSASALKDLRVFDVGIAPEPVDPIRKRVVIHLLANDKIACGVSSGGVSHNVEDVTCLNCIDRLVINCAENGEMRILQGEPADVAKTAEFQVPRSDLTMDELTHRFYAVKAERDRLYFAAQRIAKVIKHVGADGIAHLAHAPIPLTGLEIRDFLNAIGSIGKDVSACDSALPALPGCD